jgi:deoxyxylulose-5-phosphate synthase
VEDGVVTNGFGAYLAELVQTFAPEVRVLALGAADRTYEHAPRAKQLESVGLTADGIAARVRALSAEEAAPDGGRTRTDSSAAPPAGSRPAASTTAISP